MTEAIADAIDALAETSQMKPVDLSPPLEQFAVEISAYASNLFSSFSGATLGLQRRTQLLWWKEALFSASARVSYRSLDEIVAASLMAFDLFQQLPMLSPASVQSFLGEAVRLVQASGSNETRTLHDLVEIAASHRDLAEFRRVTADLVRPSNRLFLHELLSSRAHVRFAGSAKLLA
jgi:GTPase-associated system helical domain